MSGSGEQIITAIHRLSSVIARECGGGEQLKEVVLRRAAWETALATVANGSASPSGFYAGRFTYFTEWGAIEIRMEGAPSRDLAERMQMEREARGEK